MPKIQFPNQQKEILIDKIKAYFRNELDQEIASFPAEFLLDFFTEQIGPHYYNQGLADAQQFLEIKMEEMTDQLYWSA